MASCKPKTVKDIVARLVQYAETEREYYDSMFKPCPENVPAEEWRRACANIQHQFEYIAQIRRELQEELLKLALANIKT